MALSKKRTTLSVLREILGSDAGNIQAIARMTRKKPDWVKKVSCGDRELQEHEARALEIATGVSKEWLLAGDPEVAPFNAYGSPYTRATFEQLRFLRRSGVPGVEVVVRPFNAAKTIAGVAGAAGKDGKVELFASRLATFLKEIEREFGFDHAEFYRAAEAMNNAPGDLANFGVTDYDRKAPRQDEWMVKAGKEIMDKLPPGAPHIAEMEYNRRQKTVRLKPPKKKRT